jgi:hypothetical protein
LVVITGALLCKFCDAVVSLSRTNRHDFSKTHYKHIAEWIDHASCGHATFGDDGVRRLELSILSNHASCGPAACGNDDVKCLKIYIVNISILNDKRYREKSNSRYLASGHMELSTNNSSLSQW